MGIDVGKVQLKVAPRTGDGFAVCSGKGEIADLARRLRTATPNMQRIF